MNYEQWYKEYVEGHPEAETNEKRVKNKSADRKQHEEYRKILGDDVPESLEKFQEMKYNKFEEWNKEKGLYRNTGNRGAFSSLPERMSKKHVKEIAHEFGIDLN